MLGDVEAGGVALLAGIFTHGQRAVDLVADFLADGRAFVEALVVAAGVECGGHDEDRLRADERDGGTGRIDERRGLFALDGRLGRGALLRAGRLRVRENGYGNESESEGERSGEAKTDEKA